MIDAVIRYRRRHAPHAPAFSRPEGDISFTRLDADVGALASRLAARFGATPHVARVEVTNPALAWVAAAAAQRIGWPAGFARSSGPTAGFGPATIRVTDAADAVADVRTVCLEPSLLAPGFPAPASCEAVASCQTMLFDRPDGGELALTGEAVEIRMGEVDWLLPTGQRMACLIGPQSPFGLAVALRQWMKGGTVCLPAPKAPLGGLGPNRRLDLLVMEPPRLAALLEALAPDAAPVAGLTVVLYGGPVPRALTLAAHLRLAAEVVLVHGDEDRGLVAMGVDTVVRRDGEVGPLAPWLDAADVAMAPGVALNAEGVVIVEEVAAP